MKRALRCTGYVAAGIGIAAGIVLIAFIIVGILMCAAVATNAGFDLPDKYGLLFFVGYAVVLGGGICGALHCGDAS